MKEKTHSDLIDLFYKMADTIDCLSFWSKGAYDMISEEDIVSFCKMVQEMRSAFDTFTDAERRALSSLKALKVRDGIFYKSELKKDMSYGYVEIDPCDMSEIFDILSVSSDDCFFICDTYESYEEALEIVKNHILTLAKSYASCLKRSWDVVKTLGGNKRLEDSLKRLLKRSDFFCLTSDDLDYIWQILLVHDDVFGKKDTSSSDNTLRRRKT